MLYTVGEMARLLNLAPSTLRYYDKEGLLPFVERSSGGMRMFSDSDHELLQVIECLKRTGLSLKDIRSFVTMAAEGDATIDARLALFTRRREEVLRQIAELQETLDIVDFKKWYYETAHQAGTTAAVEGMADDELPERFRAIRRKLRRKDAEGAGAEKPA